MHVHANGEREAKRIHSLFIDDLKVNQESHQQLVAVNEILVLGAYHVSTFVCTEPFVYEHFELPYIV